MLDKNYQIKLNRRHHHGTSHRVEFFKCYFYCIIQVLHLFLSEYLEFSEIVLFIGDFFWYLMAELIDLQVILLIFAS